MYTVIRDTREKVGQGWKFNKTADCAGMIEHKLESGDYSLRHLEQVFTIERKGSVSEWAGNLFQKRFYNEMERLRLIEDTFIVLEFTLEDLMNYPKSTDIPKYKWKYLKVKAPLLLTMTHKLQIDYPTRVIYAGKQGALVAKNLFNRMASKWQKLLTEK